MKLFARMMRVVGMMVIVLAVFAGAARAATVPIGWPVVADPESSPAGVAPSHGGALISLEPSGPLAGKQRIVAPDGYALAHENYFVDPVSLTQRADQVYAVADESGKIIEVDLVTGKQRLLWSGAPLVKPRVIVADPATGDLFVLDSGAGSDPGSSSGPGGAIFRLQEDQDLNTTLTLIHDGGAGAAQKMRAPRGMSLEPSGSLLVSDQDASPNFYTNGTTFRVNPGGPDPGDGSVTPRVPIAWNGLFLDPTGIVARQGEAFVADPVDNLSDSKGAIIRIDTSSPTAPAPQKLISRSFGPTALMNYFNGAVAALAPVDATFGQPGSTATNDDLYALDPEAGGDIIGDRGEITIIDPTDTVAHPLNPSNNQKLFSWNGQVFNGNSALHAFAKPRALVTSRDLPDPPTISVNTAPGDATGAQVVEPEDFSGQQPVCGLEGSPGCSMKFQVRLSAPWNRTVRVHYSLAPSDPNKATAASDYLPVASGVLEFTPGAPLVQTIAVDVLRDTTDEDSENVRLTLDSPEVGVLDVPARSSALGTILDNDAPPRIIAASQPPDLIEKDATVKCALTLSEPSAKPITVKMATADGSATQPADYVSASGTATFAPGVTAASLLATVKDDVLFEDTEEFFVNLTDPTNASVDPVASKCTFTILDIDPPPKVSIRDVKSNEGNSGQRSVALSVALSGPSGKKTSVKWSTEDGSATTSDKDYPAASGTLDIAAGALTGTIPIKITSDTKVEQDESFKVVLSSPVNATILSGTGTVTIINDDANPSDPGGDVQEEPPATGGTPTKVCTSRRSFTIRVKKTKLRAAKVTSAKVYVNKKLVTTRKGKRLTAPVVLKGLKKGTYRVVIKAKLTDGRTVTDVRIYHTCVPKGRKS